ncbi:hypothetical protein NLJ89_g10632 [Agrocybe chaxingu]|uniref:Uncharacterized protein n=1 Tax=Agrocybe chaxingu TaxID=84603 RepID=A0A9W8MQ38_9AGAR|nr:hypothetical protein NLJ89_g10632 [Agrocybe chaxingu]
MKFLSLIALISTALAQTALGVAQLDLPTGSVTDLPIVTGLPTVTSGLPQIGDTPLSQLGVPWQVSGYIAVKYQSKESANFTYHVYSYNDCVQYDLNGGRALMAEFCKTVVCNGHPNPDCSGGLTPPVPVTVIKDTVIVNPDNVAKFLQQGAICQESPDVPIVARIDTG